MKSSSERRRDGKALLHRGQKARGDDRFAERVPPTTELGRLFVELAEIEWKHKTELQSEFDGSVAPEEFLLDM